MGNFFVDNQAIKKRKKNRTIRDDTKPRVAPSLSGTTKRTTMKTKLNISHGLNFRSKIVEKQFVL